MYGDVSDDCAVYIMTRCWGEEYHPVGYAPTWVSIVQLVVRLWVRPVRVFLFFLQVMKGGKRFNF